HTHRGSVLQCEYELSAAYTHTRTHTRTRTRTHTYVRTHAHRDTHKHTPLTPAHKGLVPMSVLRKASLSLLLDEALLHFVFVSAYKTSALSYVCVCVCE